MSSRTDMLNDGARARAEAAARRARLAPMLSMAVAAAGAALVLVFVGQAGMFQALKPSRDMPAVSIEKPEQINTQNSRLAGFDKERQPYELTAEVGYQDKDAPNLVHMEKVRGAFRKQSGATYELISDLGLYDTKSKQMDLSGGVQIVEPGRMTASMDKASVGVEDKSLVTDVPVKVVMGSSIIHANGMKITDDGRNILFLNGVKARFNGASGGKGDQSP
jgi:lipopolysaccharide export system protein LptC